MDATLTVGMSEAKANFSRLTAAVNQTGEPITVFKNNRPWVEIRPLASDLDVPAETAEAMEQIEAMGKQPNHKKYRTAESLFSALGI